MFLRTSSVVVTMFYASILVCASISCGNGFNYSNPKVRASQQPLRPGQGRGRKMGRPSFAWNLDAARWNLNRRRRNHDHALLQIPSDGRIMLAPPGGMYGKSTETSECGRRHWRLVCNEKTGHGIPIRESRYCRGAFARETCTVREIKPSMSISLRPVHLVIRISDAPENS